MILDRIFKTLLAALIAATLAACASTKPTAEWINESYSGQVSHVLIIGATRRNERRHLDQIEILGDRLEVVVRAGPGERTEDDERIGLDLVD